jgi:hypothetical protein
MNRVLYFLANGFAGIVLVLLLLDPARPLAPIFVLLALAVVCAVVPWFLRRTHKENGADDLKPHDDMEQ